MSEQYSSSVSIPPGKIAVLVGSDGAIADPLTPLKPKP